VFLKLTWKKEKKMENPTRRNLSGIYIFDT